MMQNRLIDGGKYIGRFSLQIRIAHWVNALSIFMLFLTGLPIYSSWFGFMFSLFGGAEMARLIHRIFAIVILVPTPFIILTDRAGFMNWTGQITSWQGNDFKFLKAFPYEFLSIKTDIPKQGFFNAGQKANSLLTIFACGVMVITGFIMWFHESFPQIVVQWAYPFHSLFAAVIIAVVLGHIYLGVGDRKSRPSFRGMTEGYVSAEYAKDHHGLWYDEVMEENKK